MGKFLRVTAIKTFYSAYPDFIPTKIEEVMTINSDMIVCIEKKKDGGCHITYTGGNGVIDVSESYEHFANIFHPPCHLGNPRG